MKKILLLALALLLLLVAVFVWPHYHPDLPLETLKEKYTYPESRFIPVQGMDVHYRSTGEGPALVLLHGTGASLHTWEGWTQQLNTAFRVVSLDLPAFGLTGPHPERDYSIDSYVRFLDAFTDSLQLDSFHLAGNSLGGLIAWRYAAAHPERIRRLVLIDPAGFPHDRPATLAFRLARNSLTAKILLKITPRSLYRNTLEEVYAEDSKVTDALVTRYFELFRRSGNRQAFVDRMNQSSSLDTMALARIDRPVLLQWGRQDDWIPVEDARRFQQLLPLDTLIVYEDLGHVPMEEAPGRTAGDARIFLKEKAPAK